jgi:hypothetical protein
MSFQRRIGWAVIECVIEKSPLHCAFVMECSGLSALT